MTAMENGRDPEVLRMFSDAMHMLDQAEAHRKRAALAPTVDGEYEHLEKAKALEKKARRLLTKLDVRQDQDLLARHRRSRTGAAEEHTPECPCAHKHEGDKTVRPCEEANEATAPVVYEAAVASKLVEPGQVLAFYDGKVVDMKYVPEGRQRFDLAAMRIVDNGAEGYVLEGGKKGDKLFFVGKGSRTSKLVKDEATRERVLAEMRAALRSGAAEMPGPLASVAGSAVGATVAAALAAEESTDCVSWTKIGADPDARAACVEMAKKIGPIDNARKVYDLLHKEFAKRDQETFVVVPLDVRGQLRSRPIEVAYGQRSRVSVGVADVMRAAVVSGAEMIILSHAHPSGAARPSKADRDLTKAVDEACKAMGSEIVMVDHVVVGSKEFYSIKEGKLYKA